MWVDGSIFISHSVPRSKEVHTKLQILQLVAYAHLICGWISDSQALAGIGLIMYLLFRHREMFWYWSSYMQYFKTCQLLRVRFVTDTHPSGSITLLHTGHFPGIRLVEALTIWLSTEHNSTSGKIVEMLLCPKSLRKAFAIIFPPLPKGGCCINTF